MRSSGTWGDDMAAVSLSKQALEQLWIRNGGRPAAANMAASIALAESGGNPNALNDNTDGSIDRGAWQINSVHGALSTTDLNANARAAVIISNNGTDWSPWVTYKQGKEIPFLSGNQAGSGLAPSSSSSTPAGSSGQSSSTGAYSGLGGFLLKAVLTVSLVGAGLALAGVGARNALVGGRSGR
jgi:Lysozyme like domain